ncbi:MAG: hypothetical protein IKJ40_01555 [Bacteroidales bacterium]|nr:hypothetical protein [Bacteroidales bacterium]
MNKASLSKQSKKAVATVVTAIAVLTMCAFSTSEKSTTDPPKDKKPVVAFAHLNSQPDSVTVSILGEDVATIVFGAKKATLSHLNPMESPADGEPTIGGVKVSSTLGTLNKTDLSTIQFLMADSAFYNNGPVTVTSPYAPNYALSFTKGKQKIDLVFSLVSFEMGIVKDGKLTKVVRYNNARQVTRFFRLVSQNNTYDMLINIQ